ncbi:hypothetical protein Lal_00040245 [Lupinus albus]|uniref:Putative transcription factor MADS-type1 family n=1 Tax=Lupinus albus TaxID=3870 RepID=A0A6A4R470_LUPAL|nr:putative transcription factor MADS-type1 family [Lupinus albus]KAF1877529.1 hypothetical protein Lal_00040245 [Lupinus albus]
MSNPMPNANNPKKSKGRQRIEMKKITKESNLQVTFTKRRNGLFKKANELCTLCDAQVALLVFSPSNKLFSFGKPSVDAVIDRYLLKDQPQNLENMQYLQELTDKINEINEDLETEKKCSEDIAKERKEAQEQFWWASPIEDMKGNQLGQFKLALENLKKDVKGVVERKNIGQGGSAAIPPPNLFKAAPSSSNIPLQTPSQLFPQAPSHMLQNQPMILTNNMFNGAMMNHPTFNNNNMGGYGPAGGFF